ncbi:MAG: type II toxin-antitoxin system RatA family toxin [Alphaproteobacteria bacterium]|nr:type II toxin-antitoxin system RatA family toxin [Alphaproteobacteria bacterium]MCY4498445.1 type II toxin-antitoxin system RatA family toxin [Rhodospirillaceae bacterium]
MPTHAEVRVLHHPAEQLFDLVADVEKYPEFLPWCVDARIRRREDSLVVADLVIGYRVFRERFTSTVVLNRPDRIDVTYAEGPFRYLNNHWIFVPEGSDSCTIDFFVDFEFHSRVLQVVAERVFGEAVKLMVHAFERRADELFGSDVPPEDTT